jgi:anti-sigma B factor antagonist
MAAIRTSPPPSPAVRSVAGATVVAPHGEIDLETARPLRERLDLLTAVDRPDVVVDLSGVSFIDCSGLGVLCRARSRVLERGGRLRLVSACPKFLRILRQVGLTELFEVHPGLNGGADGAGTAVR